MVQNFEIARSDRTSNTQFHHSVSVPCERPIYLPVIEHRPREQKFGSENTCSGDFVLLCNCSCHGVQVFGEDFALFQFHA